MTKTSHRLKKLSRRTLLGASTTLAASAAAFSQSDVATVSQVRVVEKEGLAIRPNAKLLSEREKTALVEAILQLKRTQSPIDPSLCFYDQIVRLHQLTVLRARLALGHGLAHEAPSFLPWHRRLLLIFEDALRAVSGDPTMTLPYWDWTDPAAIPVIFSENFMGPETGDPNDSYAVEKGPFNSDNFPVNLTAAMSQEQGVLSQCPFPMLTRGPHGDIKLPTKSDIAALMSITSYDAPPYDVDADIRSSFRNYLLGIPTPGAPASTLAGQVRLHSLPHTWVGGAWDAIIFNNELVPKTGSFVGTMAALDCSPNDPVFWLHHCNVDRIWAMWETLHGDQYAPVMGGFPGWNLNDTLYPFDRYQDNQFISRFGITNASMLNTLSLGYTYDDLSVPKG